MPKTIEVQGCATCPFSRYDDRITDAPYFCRIIRRGQNEPDKAPDWCPLRIEERLIKLRSDGGW